MSGPTNRRFVRSAWALLAFQFVAAGGATALAVWAATKVQALVDQRDQLQARVTQLEAHQPPADVAPVTGNVIMREEPPVPEPVTQAPPPPRHDRPGVTVHTPPPPPVIVHTPPPRQPPVTYVPPRQPPVRDKPPVKPPVTYVPPRQPPVTYVPPRQPPVTYVPPRQPPVTYVPPRQPPATVPTRPSNITPPAQQPAPVTTTRPTRPRPVITFGPSISLPRTNTPATNQQGTTIQPNDPRRIRRPRPTVPDPQPDPPK